MTERFANRPATVAEYLAILRRRKWIIIAPPVLVGVAAFALSTMQSPLYQATVKVLVNRSSVVSSIANVQDPSSIYAADPTRYLTTQASIARSPELAARVVSAAGVPGETVTTFLRQSSVNPESTAD